MVGLMGVISADNDTFAGEVMHGSCGKFEVNRTAPLTDIAPPESTIYFPSPGGGLPTKQMVLRAEGPIMMEFGKMPREDDSGGSTPRREALQMFLNGADGLVHEARQQRRARAYASVWWRRRRRESPERARPAGAACASARVCD